MINGSYVQNGERGNLADGILKTINNLKELENYCGKQKEPLRKETAYFENN